MPSGASPLVFLLAPILDMTPAMVAWAVDLYFVDGVPLAADIHVGLLIFFAISSLGVYAVITGAGRRTRSLVRCAQPRRWSL